MDPNSPYYLFDPRSIAWLHRRHERGEDVEPADLRRLLEADPANGSDPIMIHYLLKHLDGRLARKRGRKSLEPSRTSKLMIADVLIEERAAEIKAERKGRNREQLRAELEPSVQAAEEIGEWLGLPRGRALLNLISTRKKKLNAMNARASDL